MLSACRRIPSVAKLAAVVFVASMLFAAVTPVAGGDEPNPTMGTVSLSSDAPGELTISWEPPAGDPYDYRIRWAKDGSEYLTYRLTRDGHVKGNLYAAGDATSVTVTGLNEGVIYKVQMRARYDATTSNGRTRYGARTPWSAEVTQTVMVTPPPQTQQDEVQNDEQQDEVQNDEQQDEVQNDEQQQDEVQNDEQQQDEVQNDEQQQDEVQNDEQQQDEVQNDEQQQDEVQNDEQQDEVQNDEQQDDENAVQGQQEQQQDEEVVLEPPQIIETIEPVEEELIVTQQNTCEAETAASSTEVTISDRRLRSAIERKLGKSSGDTITVADMRRLRELDARGQRIRTLSGLQYAINIEKLRLSDNAIDAMPDMCGWDDIKVLQLDDNVLEGTLDLSDLTSLVSVHVRRNFLSELLLPDHPATTGPGDRPLRTVLASENELTGEFRIGSSHPAMQQLHLDFNRLTRLNFDVGTFSAKANVAASNNLITSVNLRGSIGSLVLSNNALSGTYDIKESLATNYLNLANNPGITRVKAQGATNLRWLGLTGTQVTATNRIEGFDDLSASLVYYLSYGVRCPLPTGPDVVIQPSARNACD